jgi:hypothetical protein
MAKEGEGAPALAVTDETLYAGANRDEYLGEAMNMILDQSGIE